MAWTTPRTWVAGELVTAAMMNTHVRDNENELRGGGIAITSQAANEIIFASSATQLSRSALLTWNGTTLDVSVTDTAGANVNELLRLSRSAAGSVGDTNRMTFTVGASTILVALDAVVTAADSAALDVTTRNGGVTAVRGRVHASGGWSVGDTIDPGATNFRVLGTSALVGNVTASGTLTVTGQILAGDSIGLDGTTPSTAGIKFAAATPASTTASLYSTDGAALFFNGVQLATGASVSGTAGRVGRFTAATTIGDSIIRDDGSTIAVNTVVSAVVLVDIGGSFTAATGSIGALLAVTGTITGDADDSIAGARFTNNFVEAASGVHARITTVSVEAGSVTAGVATVTNTATLYVDNALSATVTGNNYAVWVDAGETRLDGSFVVGGATASGDFNVRIASVFTATLGATGGALFAIDGAITGAVGQTIHGARFSNNFTEAASGVHARISTVSVETGSVTAGVATVTDTATLYVQGALSATVTGGNYAVWVDAGPVRLDGGLAVGGTADPGAGNVTISGLFASADGTAGVPAYGFTSNVDCGMRLNGAQVTINSNGADVVYAELNGTNTLLAIPTRANGTGAVTGNAFSIGRNSSGNGAAGYLSFEDKTGGGNVVWVDDSATPGVMRISTSAPQEDGTPSDTSGTAVGDQSSWYEDKYDIVENADYAGALQRVLDTPVYDWRYKRHSYLAPDGGVPRFTGYVGYDRHDWFLKNVGPQQDPCLNEISVLGTLALSVKALAARLDAIGG